MKTAEEFLNEEHKPMLEDIIAGDYIDNVSIIKSTISEWLVEFAKLHVQEALEQAAEKAEGDIIDTTDDSRGLVVIDKQSILTAYPLDNIK